MEKGSFLCSKLPKLKTSEEMREKDIKSPIKLFQKNNN